MSNVIQFGGGDEDLFDQLYKVEMLLTADELKDLIDNGYDKEGQIICFYEVMQTVGSQETGSIH